MGSMLNETNFKTLYLHQDPSKCLLRSKTDGRQRSILAPPGLQHELLELYTQVVSLHRRDLSSPDFNVRFADRIYRVAVIPEPIAAYSLRRSIDITPDFEKCGIHSRIVEYLLSLEDGMVLFIGPFGSGKTTALTSFTRTYAEHNGAISLTIEDPPEIDIRGIYGTGRVYQIDAPRDRMPAVMSDMMRATYDLLMISEVRSSGIAGELIRASTNGRLLATSLHGYTIEQGLIRLISMAASSAGNSDSALQGILDTLRHTFKAAILMNQIGDDRWGAVAYLLGDSVTRGLIKNNEVADLGEPIRLLRSRLNNAQRSLLDD